MKALLFLSVLTSSLTISAVASPIVEDFSTSLYFEPTTTTGVWNLATQRLHVPLVVDRDELDAAESEDEPLTIGTGKDGVFDVSTLTSFDLNDGAVSGEVTLRGGQVYEFTTFTLPTGVTLKCSGTEPLEIRVQGTVVIDGTVDLRGAGGTGSTAGSGSPCGGASGGNGGITTSGFPGSSGGTGLGGGGGRGVTASDSGGGAGYDGAGSPGGPLGGGGAPGSLYGDNLLSTLYGGSGGGGGAASLGGLAGGGGGGGGGVFKLSSGESVTVSATGAILMQGGLGATGGGGDGGGGSGGGLYLQMRDTFTHLGTTDARGGDGGTDGGNAAPGRVRYIQNNPAFVPGGTFPVGPNMVAFGKPAFSKIRSYIVETKPYDTGLRFSAYTSLTPEEALNGGSVTYEIAGSSDAFQTDTTGFLEASRLDELRGKRYFKYRITMQSVSATATPEVLGLSLSVSEAFQKDFHFRGAACSSVHRSAPSQEGLAFFTLFLFYLFLLPRVSKRVISCRERERA